MIVYSLALSRLVPLLLWVSALLVAGRTVHDWLERRNRVAARASFAAILAGGIALVSPFGLRSAFLVGALDAHLEGRWSDAIRRWSAYAELGGRPSARTRQRWAESLIAQRRYRDAEALLLGGLIPNASGTVRTLPEVIFTLGVCRYYSGRWPEAERTFRAVDSEPSRYLRDYFLGRIAERRGDRAAAWASYAASLAADPAFFPALYQSVRLALESGDANAARRKIEESRARIRPRDAAGLASLGDAVEGRSAPPENHEFIVTRIR